MSSVRKCPVINALDSIIQIHSSRVEDHDDLVPIFNRQSDSLKTTYGDYFLAELIEAEDEEMKCIVAEVRL